MLSKRQNNRGPKYSYAELVHVEVHYGHAKVTTPKRPVPLVRTAARARVCDVRHCNSRYVYTSGEIHDPFRSVALVAVTRAYPTCSHTYVPIILRIGYQRVFVSARQTDREIFNNFYRMCTDDLLNGKTKGTIEYNCRRNRRQNNT